MSRKSKSPHRQTESEATLKQQVDVTLKLSLWLDARMGQDDIVTYVRSSLPEAFGKDLTAMTNPVDILYIREEAEIYSPVEDSGPTRRPWAAYRLADDPETYGSDAGKFIVTTADAEVEVTGIVHNPADACLIAASPRLLDSLKNCARLLADHEGSDGEEGNAWREAIAAISEARGECSFAIKKRPKSRRQSRTVRKNTVRRK